MFDPRITLVTGDLTTQEGVHAIVNAANDHLLAGGGVCGAIFKAAGLEALQAQCYKFPPDRDGIRCSTGSAVTTGAGELPFDGIIHAVGPVYDKTGPNPLISNAVPLGFAYRSIIEEARKEEFKRIAVPALSCGIFGYPLEEAARIAIIAVSHALRDCWEIEEVRFVFLPMGDGPEVQKAFEDALNGSEPAEAPA